MQEKEHVIEILIGAKKAIREEDIGEIKSLSNQTIHSASIYQDPDNIALAVILYTISKLIEREKYHTLTGWKEFEKNYEKCLERAIISLKKDQLELYREQIDCIRDFVRKLSGNLKKYVEEVLRKAQINKASKIYEHGISLEATAKILGLTLWELNQYVGQAGIGDVNLAYTLDIRKRIKNAEEMFRR